MININYVLLQIRSAPKLTANVGLILYKNNKLSELKFEEESINVTGIIEWKKKLYFATLNKGLLTLNDGKLERYLIDGKPIDFEINKIRNYEGFIYVLSENKLFRFNAKSKNLTEFNVSNGLSHEKIIDFKIYNNQLWAITTESIQQIDLSSLPIGVFQLTIRDNERNEWRKKIIKKR